MIVVDTSALMAIVLDEAGAESCVAALAGHSDILISAGTVAEALIVADRRNTGREMRSLIDGLGFQVVPLTGAASARIAAAYAKWGKGVHRAGLNLGDCFAYELAMARGCGLLYVGDDFSRTDVAAAPAA